MKCDVGSLLAIDGTTCCLSRRVKEQEYRHKHNVQGSALSNIIVKLCRIFIQKFPSVLFVFVQVNNLQKVPFSHNFVEKIDRFFYIHVSTVMEDFCSNSKVTF